MKLPDEIKTPAGRVLEYEGGDIRQSGDMEWSYRVGDFKRNLDGMEFGFPVGPIQVRFVEHDDDTLTATVMIYDVAFARVAGPLSDILIAVDKAADALVAALAQGRNG